LTINHEDVNPYLICLVSQELSDVLCSSYLGEVKNQHTSLMMVLVAVFTKYIVYWVLIILDVIANNFQSLSKDSHIWAHTKCREEIRGLKRTKIERQTLCNDHDIKKIRFICGEKRKY